MFILPWTRQAVLDAYNRANLKVTDIDFFETHDCFTSSEYAAISAFGITEPGKEFEAIESRSIMFDGEHPHQPERRSDWMRASCGRNRGYACYLICTSSLLVGQEATRLGKQTMVSC